MRWVACMLIRIYQLCLGPFTSGACRFYPSCSEYALEALKTFGLWKGGWMTLWRLIRCGPWHPGGYDPVSAATGDDQNAAGS